MSLFGDVFEIGASIVGGLFGGGDEGSSQTVVAPQYDSLMTPLKGGDAVVSSVDRRKDDPTKKAQTVKEKTEGGNEPILGDDSVELAKMWNRIMKEAMNEG